ncbi:HAUS augmin-like complex subunit 2 [Frankliniella fusca]|uniref:HAUS augmin-like complex subunit 2 n=1 Tax=Frankliniella fusca TaxID=407009 RepID=A0AAE1LBC9_9NEOP|nr:HAUS augmin-like complex subunit 2 [Frankliniella fusca]
MEEAALRIQKNLTQVFSQCQTNSCSIETKSTAVENVTTEDCLPSSLSTLPIFSILKQISDIKSQKFKLQSELDLKPFLKDFEQVDNIVYEGLNLASSLASCIEFIHNSSQILQQVLKDPMAQDALPFPHHLHRKVIDIIEACVWIIQNPRWQALRYEVEWESLLPKLKQEVSDWMLSAKLSVKHLKELEDLKRKLDVVFGNYPFAKS